MCWKRRLALQEHFNLGNAEVLKAATVMPDIALRGDTCGAVIAGIMAPGLTFGRESRRSCRRLEHDRRRPQAVQVF